MASVLPPLIEGLPYCFVYFQVVILIKYFDVVCFGDLWVF